MATMLRSLAARRYLWSSSSLARSYSSHQHPALVGKGFTRTPSRRIHPISDCSSPFVFRLRRAFSCNVNQLPGIADPDIEAAFKDLMAMNWDEIPDSVTHNTKKSLSKATGDKTGQEALANAFRAAEASAEFSGILVSLRMALDDLSGISGENVGQLPEYLEDGIKTAYKRYITYLDSFSPDETYLRKKVETELGTKMIHLKMRCSGIGSEWGKVTLLGTSGLSGDICNILRTDIKMGSSNLIDSYELHEVSSFEGFVLASFSSFAALSLWLGTQSSILVVVAESKVDAIISCWILHWVIVDSFFLDG
ncbi:hypothetical protein OPV22_022809 [Ensete ventricosum]|uniref:Succinate dehydrogenase subunit 5, mitochondrial n=1 Tax=Ensete ventricosum TaxID=4639 RepID=A0AAV8QKD1_ENSVE|nr:hypothetical protein OPV22_022809 [Ensete ventricosum]